MNCSPFYCFLPGQRHPKERQSALQKVSCKGGEGDALAQHLGSPLLVWGRKCFSLSVLWFWYRSVVQPAPSTGQGEWWMLLCSAHRALSISYTQRLPDQLQDAAFSGRALMPADLISYAGPCWRLQQLCHTGHSWRDEVCFQTAEPHLREKVGLALLLSSRDTAARAWQSPHHPWPYFIFAGLSHLSVSI